MAQKDKKKFYYGGQAVIEGVMIRGRNSVVTAVRRPGGEVGVDVRPLSAIYTGRLRRLPLVRGIVVLIEAMVLGIKSLLYSANVAVEEETEEIGGGAIFLMLASAAVLVVALFFLAPLFLTGLLANYVTSSIGKNVIEGVIRLIIFIAYLKVMALLPDIKRVFTYHGAEHKTVNAYEAGVPMEVDAIRSYSTAHVRCGTSFLFTVLIIAIVVFSLVGWPTLWIRILSRVLLIPVIAAIGYEITYFSARHTGNWMVKVLLAPGLLLQSLTTGEPDDQQMEVAIAAMNRAVEVDQTGETAPASP
jgi:uncharacterized protein YqhQ